MDAITITPRRDLDATVSIPGSKSCTARALVMAGLTRGESWLEGAADCDDATYMLSGLTGLGVACTRTDEGIAVSGGPFCAPSSPLFVGNSGTAMRFLAAACATVDGTVMFDGTERMRQRPIDDLVAALAGWGVEASAPTGCPPLTVRATGAFGGRTHIRGNASSQYLSGLLMAAACASDPAEIMVDGELVSKPYVDLTLAMMAERGVSVAHEAYAAFCVPAGQRYAPGRYAIEADASGASYFLAAPAIAGGRVRVRHLTRRSLQGDVQFAGVLERMGCTVAEGPDWLEVRSDGRVRGVDIDLNAMPDMAQTLAVTALFAEGPTTIRNVGNLRIKECDRIRATVTELRKLGAEAEEYEDGLRIVPGPLHGAAIDTYEDHRMAMSFAMAGLRIPNVRINDPACVSKTFPDFFTRFGALR